MIVGMLIPAIEAFSLKSSELEEEKALGFMRVQTAEVFFVFVLFSSFPCMEFRVNLLVYSLNAVNWIVLAAARDGGGAGFVEIAYFVVVIGVTHLTYIYMLFKLQIKNFNSLKCLQKKAKEQSHILSNLLPKHVLEKFLNNPETMRLELADEFEDVTILFADIAGFTKYSSQVEPD